MDRLTLTAPDDWHLHVRDGDVLADVVPATARRFARAIIMPNLVPPVTTTQMAQEYKQRILDALHASGAPAGSFEPMMTMYLTDTTSPEEVKRAAESGDVKAFKLYPAGVTTNSASGVTDLAKVTATLQAMAHHGMPLCVHGEVTDPAIDIFDREAVFLETVLAPLRERLPELRVVLEHVTTENGVDYVKAQDKNVGATITTHHLMINRNAILAGGIKPHYYCLPVAKREAHRKALVAAAISGNARFFLGTDSAPHVDPAKECGCGCAGIYTAPNTMSCLAHVFENEDALDKLEAFASLNGPAWYGLKPNEETITLIKRDEPVKYPEKRETGAGPVTVFDPKFPLYWDVETA